MPRFSLVITTTDRPSLLPAGVRAALETHFDDIEVVVSDNFSKIPAAEILADVRDERLRVIRTDRRLSVSDHWEFVWGHLRGEYVMYLGDDNALHPEILAFADRAIKDHDLDVISWRVGTYFHPDWNVSYGSLPNRGNIIFIGLGSTQQLYQCDAGEVLAHFCRHLRTYSCFACMLNCLFRKSIGDEARRIAGRIFWGGVPETSSSFIVLGMARPGKYAFYDGFGALAGRSGDSAFASMLSRGKASKRHHEYIAEFGGQDLLPMHEPKFLAISNVLAGTISIVRDRLPDYFSQYSFDRVTLARKTIDDLYVDKTVPFVNDPDMLAQVEQFINTLPPAAAAEILAYRDQCRTSMLEAEKAAEMVPPPKPAEPGVGDFWRKLISSDKRFAWRLYRETGRNPIGRYWVSGGTTCIDMALYDGHDIADAARNLPRVLKDFDTYNEGFLTHHRDLNMLGRRLRAASPERAVAEAKVLTGVGRYPTMAGGTN